MTVDIRESTKMPPENMLTTHREIDEIIAESRSLFPDSLLTIGFTAGDEFEIVTRRPDEILKMMYYLRGKISTQFRVGVGAGTIESPDDDSTPNQMWGTAFERARDALNQAKENDIEMHVMTLNAQTDERVNTILELINHIRSNLTYNQTRIIDQYNYYSNIENLKTQRELANILNVSDPMISKTLKKSGYQQLKKGEQLVQTLLNEYKT